MLRKVAHGRTVAVKQICHTEKYHSYSSPNPLHASVTDREETLGSFTSNHLPSYWSDLESVPFNWPAGHEIGLGSPSGDLEKRLPYRNPLIEHIRPVVLGNYILTTSRDTLSALILGLQQYVYLPM